MKVFGAIGTTALLLLMGATVPAIAQQDHKDKNQGGKPAQHEAQAKPAQHEQQAKPAQEQHTQQAHQQSQPAQQQHQQAQQSRPVQQQHTQQAQQDRPAQQQHTQQPQQSRPQQQQRTQQAQQSRPAQQQHTEQAQNRGGPHQGPQRSSADQQRQRSVPALRLSVRSQNRIPDDRFRSNFGRGHEFRIGSPRMVGGYSRFQYGGFWFGFIQPWPSYWYYTDDVYVDYYDGGYYLYNPYYPDDRIMISVVL